MNSLTKQRRIIVFSGLAVIFAIGSGITQLMVHDTVALTEEEKSCVRTSILQHFDHPLQRIALVFGKSAAVEK